MPEGGLISVIVPVYGIEAYIEQCIESLVAQTHRDIEVILVDDGSPDRCGEICDAYARRDRRLRVVHKENGGLVSARKAGVAVARGAYLGFVDGDDWVAHDYFAGLFEHAESMNADLVVSGHIREFHGKEEPIPPRSPPGFYDRLRIETELLPTAVYNGTFFQHGVSTYVWNKLFRRERASHLLQAIDENIVMGEDAALTYPYLAASERVVVAREGGYFYRQRSNSIVKSVPDIDREYRRLSALFRHLKGWFVGKPCAADMLRQLRHYFYAQVLIRSGGVVQLPGTARYVIPFPGMETARRIVVYSSGSFGQHMVGAIRRIGQYELVGWVDEDVEESQRCGLPVSSLDTLSSMDFDLVLVASIDREFSEKVRLQLQEKDVPADRISILSLDFTDLEGRLAEVGFDVGTFEYCPRA